MTRRVSKSLLFSARPSFDAIDDYRARGRRRRVLHARAVAASAARITADDDNDHENDGGSLFGERAVTVLGGQ